MQTDPRFRQQVMLPVSEQYYRLRMLYLIGVDHSVQHDGRAAYEGSEFQKLRDKFPAFVEEIASELGATVIAEECNDDVLNKFGATKSVGYTVASELGIKHMFCEPSIDEKEQIGIKNLGKPEDFDKREHFWLKKIISMRGETILFILGASHAQSFSELAKNAGFCVNVAEEYYGREYFARASSRRLTPTVTKIRR